MTDLQRAILTTLSYYDLFEYSLTKYELYQYLISYKTSMKDLSKDLQALIPKYVKEDTGQYTLAHRTALINKKQMKHNLAQKVWSAAWFWGWIFASIPFVRFVAVTGTLAKNTFRKNDDYDFFIISQPKYVWFVRLVAFLIVNIAKIWN